MRIQRTTMTTVAAALLFAGAAGCGPNAEPPSAKTEMAGKIVFSQGSFDDAKDFKSFEEFKAAHNVIEELVVEAPQSSLRYYAVFEEALGANEYIVQVFDRTNLGESVRVEKRDATPTTGQTTAGWAFDVPEWPIPEDDEKILTNNIWIEPGHSYEVLILKPLARGKFRVAKVPEASAKK